MVFDRWSEVFVIRGKKMENGTFKNNREIHNGCTKKQRYIVGGCINKDFGSSIW